MKTEEIKRLVVEIDRDTNYKLRLHLLQNDESISGFMRRAINSAIKNKGKVQHEQSASH